MALQSSGAIKMSQIKAELGSSSNSLRAYSLQAGLSTPDKLSDFYGYAALGSFSFADWNGSVSVNLNGIVSYVTGNAAAVSVSPTTFALVGTNTTQTIDVTITVPSGYSNSGGTVTGTKTAVQPPKVFAYTDWVSAGGSVSINRNTGNVSYSNGTLGTVSSISPSSFDLVTSSTSRNVTVNVTVPSGYYNSGATVTGTFTTTQAAADETITITLNGSGDTWSPSGQGASTTLSVDIVNVWNTAWTIQLSDSSWLSVVSSTGTGDGTTTLVAGPNYVGEAGYNGSVRSGWIKVYKTSDSGIYDIVNIYQEVGVAPVYKPTVSLTAPANTIFGWNEYGNPTNYKLYTGTWTGGSTPTQGSFYMNSTDFAFVDTDSNVVVSQPSTGNWVGTITNASSSPYTIGVYAVNSNSSTTTAKSATISFSLSNTAGSNSATATIGQSVSPPTFAFGDWTGGVSVSQGGTVSYTTGNAAAVSVSPTSYAIVNTDTSRTITVTVTVPSGYSNSGGTVSGTKTATQSSTPTFTFANAGVSGFAVGQDGTIYAPTVSTGTISSITYVGSNSNTSYSRVSSNTTRTATVYVTVPGGYYNSGGTVSGNTTTTQIASAIFSYSDAGVSGFAVSQNGNVTPPTVSAGSILSLIYGGTYDEGPHGEITYPIVNTITERYVDVYITAPSGYYNSGETVSGTAYANQAATATFGFSDWNGSVSVDSGGSVNYTTGNAAAVSVSPTSYAVVYTDTSRTINVTVTVPSGYYNSGLTVSGTKTVTQPAAAADPTVTVYTTCGGANYFIEGTYYYPNIEIAGNCAYYAESTNRSVAVGAGYTEFFSISNSECTC